MVVGRRKTTWLALPPRMKGRRLASGKVLYYYQAAGKQIPLGSNLLAAKEQWARLEAGTGGTQRFPKVSVLYRKTFEGLAESTKSHYRIALDNLDLAFAAFTLDELQPKHVKEYMRRRTKKGAARLERRVLSAFFNWARGDVRAAYSANGWHPSPGRPSADAKGTGKKGRVPSTVRTYVSAVRRAIRAGLPVTKYRSFTALRADLARVTSPAEGPSLPRSVRPSFVGVSVQAPREPNGALFHDLGAVYITLPAEHRDIFGRQLARLLQKYLPLANITRPAAVEEPEAPLGKAKRRAA